MGRGGAKKALPEIDETRAAAKDDQFNLIIERITTSGGEIIDDDTDPLYIDIGMDEFEIGYVRTVEFAINKMEFKLIRKVETHILQGASRQKHVEELSSPRVKLSLKKKSPHTNAWEVMDLEDIF